MVRIVGNDIPGEKKMIVGLTQIRGIGYMFANTILNVLKINPGQRIGYLLPEQIKSIENVIKNPSASNFPSWFLNRRKDVETGEDKHLITSDIAFTVRNDIEREKNIISDAQSNEKRLNEEKNNLIDTEKKYYDLEKQAQLDLQIATEKLKKEQDKLETISKNLSLNSQGKEFINYLNNINQNLKNAKTYLENNEDKKALDAIDNIIFSIRNETKKFETTTEENSVNEITELTNKIKLSQEKYASALSKNQSIQTETIRRQERIKNID